MTEKKKAPLTGGAANSAKVEPIKQYTSTAEKRQEDTSALQAVFRLLQGADLEFMQRLADYLEADLRAKGYLKGDSTQ